MRILRPIVEVAADLLAIGVDLGQRQRHKLLDLNVIWNEFEWAKYGLNLPRTDGTSSTESWSGSALRV
jgi:hypothetical protein